MDCRVVVEAAVPVYDVETADEAVRIAISKTGEMLNPDLNYVEISMGVRTCPHCDGTTDPAFIAADEGLVALDLEMKVFNVERDEHAARIARKEIGQRLQNIPLEVLEVEEVAGEGDDGDADDDGGSDGDADDDGGSDDADDDGGSDGSTTGDGEAAAGTDEGDAAAGVDGDGDDGSAATDDGGSGRAGDGGRDDDADVLPEFDDLIDG